VAGWITGLAKTESLADTIVPKVADYLASISKLIVIATLTYQGGYRLVLTLVGFPPPISSRENAPPP
jgi:hypothetical protein